MAICSSIGFMFALLDNFALLFRGETRFFPCLSKQIVLVKSPGTREGVLSAKNLVSGPGGVIIPQNAGIC
jgi:hypothetical protein